ncbi:hypothetical protein F2Q70_00034422 [Brassica cretica]|uniref:Uncharacterized protein n=2 Tax=Brassica cretica TaxID=69181 RepID=A0A3N6PYR8_BRACR|nr:hypothetical protein F2Q68_00029308 [Brassica cretica]KAF2587170.1 hypothetical protein F2Q70_00034422 [Brassica cretica]KAF3527892.1 hypothetical protein DY000_02037151 [Brassica cretica]
MPSQPLSTAAFMAVHCTSSKWIPSLRTASSSAVNATDILALQEDFDRLIGVRNIRPMQGQLEILIQPRYALSGSIVVL